MLCSNHEIEQEADGSTFKAVQARWPVRVPNQDLAHALKMLVNVRCMLHAPMEGDCWVDKAAGQPASFHGTWQVRR